jgi:hypothetical protein
MDTKILVNKIKTVIEAFAKEGKIVTCANLMKAYPDYENSPFVLAIACPWTSKYPSCYAKTEEVVSKVYQILDVESLGMIHSVNVFDDDVELERFVKSGGEEWVSNYCREFINSTVSNQEMIA